MWQWFVSGIRLRDVVFVICAAGIAAYLAKRRLTREEGLAMFTYENRKGR